MSRGGAAPKAAPVGWVHLEGRYTIRWRRGDPVVYVLGAGQMGDHGMAGVLDTKPARSGSVSPVPCNLRGVGQSATAIDCRLLLSTTLATR